MLPLNECSLQILFGSTRNIPDTRRCSSTTLCLLTWSDSFSSNWSLLFPMSIRNIIFKVENIWYLQPKVNKTFPERAKCACRVHSVCLLSAILITLCRANTVVLNVRQDTILVERLIWLPSHSVYVLQPAIVQVLWATTTHLLISK